MEMLFELHHYDAHYVGTRRASFNMRGEVHFRDRAGAKGFGAMAHTPRYSRFDIL